VAQANPQNLDMKLVWTPSSVGEYEGPLLFAQSPNQSQNLKAQSLNQLHARVTVLRDSNTVSQRERGFSCSEQVGAAVTMP
jgi:hypothetical protein